MEVLQDKIKKLQSKTSEHQKAIRLRDMAEKKCKQLQVRLDQVQDSIAILPLTTQPFPILALLVAERDHRRQEEEGGPAEENEGGCRGKEK